MPNIKCLISQGSKFARPLPIMLKLPEYKEANLPKLQLTKGANFPKTPTARQNSVKFTVNNNENTALNVTKIAEYINLS